MLVHVRPTRLAALAVALLGAACLTLSPAATAQSGGACEVASPSYDFDEVRAAYAAACAGIPRRDCDPMPGGGWHCSSGVIGAAAPRFAAKAAAKPMTAEAPSPVVVEPEPVAEPESEPEPPPAPERGSGPRDVAVSSQPADPDACQVSSLDDLRRCVSGDADARQVEVRRDLACSGDDCCPGGRSLLHRRGGGSLEIDGNGHRLLRRDGQRRCSLLDFEGVSDVTIADWRLDDDASVAGCRVEENCPRMLHVRSSRDVRLERVTVAASKGYAIYIDGVDGFGFTDSTLRDSGVLGLYVGHDQRASRRVRIERSRFVDNQTNAVALLGVEGASTGDNVVSDNVFENNHWRGQWQVEPRYGTGFTGGGQLYLAMARGVTVSGNRFEAGRCVNCLIHEPLGSGVSGIEIGRPGRRTVSNLRIVDNLVTGQDAWGIFANRDSPLDSSVVVSGNLLLGNGRPYSLPGASVSDNTTSAR